MNLYVAQPYERVRDRLMASLPPQPEFVPKTLDVIPQTMVTPEGVEVPPAATQKSSRVSKEPAQGSRAPEKRKRETSKEEDPLTSKLVIKKPAIQSASKVTTTEGMPLRHKTIK